MARYINHSCKPNAEPVVRNGGIVIVALRRIEPGEEITYDYGKEYLEYFFEEGGCRCDSCRRKTGRQAPQAAESGAAAKLGRVLTDSARWTTSAALSAALGQQRAYAPEV